MLQFVYLHYLPAHVQVALASPVAVDAGQLSEEAGQILDISSQLTASACAVPSDQPHADANDGDLTEVSHVGPQIFHHSSGQHSTLAENYYYCH